MMFFFFCCSKFQIKKKQESREMFPRKVSQGLPKTNHPKGMMVLARRFKIQLLFGIGLVKNPMS